jgi:plastocyanin
LLRLESEKEPAGTIGAVHGVRPSLLGTQDAKEKNMNRLAIFAALLAITFLTPAVATAETGTIEGTVAHARGNADLVVFVVSAPGQFSAPAQHALMDQKKMTFTPHVMPVLAGTTVDYLNSDAVAHNVFTPDNEGFNLGTWPKGEKHSYTYKKAGVYTQLCSIHPEMLAFVIVLQNPFFAITAKDGHFAIPNVPAGQYTLKVWGEKLKKPDKEKTFPVKVTGGKAPVTLSF